MNDSRLQHRIKDHSETTTHLNAHRPHNDEKVLVGYFREDDRKTKRNLVQDHNRPKFIDSSPEYEILTPEVDDGEWSDEGEENEPRSAPKRSNLLNESLNYVKNREEWQHNQQKARRRNFAKNRPGNIKHRIVTKAGEKTASITANDFAKHKSRVSLKSTDLNSTNEILYTPKKGLTKNFLTSNQVEVNRMSDIYVKPSKRLQQPEEDTRKEDSLQWKEVSTQWKEFSPQWTNVGYLMFGFCFALIMMLYGKKS